MAPPTGGDRSLPAPHDYVVSRPSRVHARILDPGRLRPPRPVPRLWRVRPLVHPFVPRPLDPEPGRPQGDPATDAPPAPRVGGADHGAHGCHGASGAHAPTGARREPAPRPAAPAGGRGFHSPASCPRGPSSTSWCARSAPTTWWRPGCGRATRPPGSSRLWMRTGMGSSPRSARGRRRAGPPASTTFRSASSSPPRCAPVDARARQHRRDGLPELSADGRTSTCSSTTTDRKSNARGSSCGAPGPPCRPGGSSSPTTSTRTRRGASSAGPRDAPAVRRSIRARPRWARWTVRPLGAPALALELLDQVLDRGEDQLLDRGPHRALRAGESEDRLAWTRNSVARLRIASGPTSAIAQESVQLAEPFEWPSPHRLERVHGEVARADARPADGDRGLDGRLRQVRVELVADIGDTVGDQVVVDDRVSAAR